MPYPRLEPSPSDLPVAAELPAIVDAIRSGSLVLTAAPGAGKSSLVPFAVDAALAATRERPQRVLVLEPRRLAARATAARLADLLGEPLGQHIGLTIRGEHTVGPACRIEVMTEAVLTRRLQSDPELPGVGALVFDEFHERNVHSDLGLAMAIEVRDTLRPELAIVVMSATIDPTPVAKLLGGAPAIDVAGRAFPVVTEHRARPSRSDWAVAVADTAAEAARRARGDVLVFAPGRREIDDVIRGLRRHGIEGVGLHGGSPAAIQRSVLAPSAVQRVIVASAIAETSVTIPGVEAVVDGGLLRRARFDPITGLGRLETGHVTLFSADQRRGRAGRTKEGFCIRLWSAEEHRLLNDAVPPEIVEGDPVPVAMELLRWGDPDATSLPLLDPPPAHRLAAARATLRWLGLVSDDGSLTASGTVAAGLPTHPRSAALVAVGAEQGQLDRALQIAAVLDGDRHPTTDDLVTHLERQQHDPAVKRSIKRLGQAVSRAGVTESKADPASGSPTSDDPASLMGRAWPDRIALARPERPGRFLLASGREVELGRSSSLAGSEVLVVVDATVDGDSGFVRLAVPLERRAIGVVAENHIHEVDDVRWDDRTDAIVATRQRRLGAIVLHQQNLAAPPTAAVHEALRTGLGRAGLDALSWSEADRAILDRLRWLHDQAPDRWPDVREAALLDQLDSWLDLSAVSTPQQLRRLRPGRGLQDLLGWEERQRFDELAPTSLPTTRGRTAKVRYDSGRPLWAVRIQELFGRTDHPLVGPNRVPVTIELLSPAGRAAQTTTDLPGFWAGSYRAVRADLRGRYPKHPWPDDPATAEPPAPRPRRR